ncbi:TIGR03986 family CRISPR-associated RAMP protein [Scytonema sp. UIC 10036]|uniref:TIGR03986 family type III CRISPR-associated RAMP protein n=1 Tax=Scytonema sp. UIC 10036 TaxID=2304196 RepID=UPI0012DA5F15|nr:TIGR03986 family CRISPR-associated RAMP protein [Scytonema sp. UIC 10036]MUH00440.1 TIGR03986 family CRISPR-associated RAMP protein [Scytonema sp. UIC 10036]
MLPRHLTNVPDTKKAIAPYNFVELPNNVVEIQADSLPSHNVYYAQSEKRYTGRIDCTLTTESPLYIRCGLTKEEFACGAESKDLPDFFYTEIASKARKPVIPGSSLRGMIRNIIEIITFSKIERVSDKQKLFFRAVAANPNKDSLGKEYKRYVEPKTVQAGYLKKDSQGWYIQPAISCNGSTFAWVRETDFILPRFKKFDDENYFSQYINVSYTEVNIDYKDRAKRLFAKNVDLPEVHPKKGVLVTSGNMKQDNQKQASPRRNHCVVFECLVFQANSESAKLRIDGTVIEHYRNALTDFQKQTPFDKDWGMLQENRPVFYYLPEGANKVNFFGQSPNFRIPYSPDSDGQASTVADFIPKNLKNSVAIDLADAIFGWVKDNDVPINLRQRGSRVFISDANYISAENHIWYTGDFDRTITPQILSEPKPTCFQHYLVQPENTLADKPNLRHYASRPIEKTVIRGHKLYWHQGNKPNFKYVNKDKTPETQLNKIKPISRGVKFKFNVHFENLSDIELGALLWVMNISSDRSQIFGIGKQNEEYRLSLGMGKPLGMGAVKIEPTLYLSARNSRYKQLFDNKQWNQAESTATDDQQLCFIQEFEKYIILIAKISDDDKPKESEVKSLKCLPRIEMLLAMLQWKPVSDIEQQTRYMEIERDVKKPYIGRLSKSNDPTVNEYKERPVLPTPLQIRNIVDNRKLPTTPSKSSDDSPQKSFEKPKLKPKNNRAFRPNYYRNNSDDGNNSNPAIQRPKPPKK